MPRYFKPQTPSDGRNYKVTRITRSGKRVRDQLPFEGVYTPYEMECIVEQIPGQWIVLKPRNVGYIFGLRQIIGE